MKPKKQKTNTSPLEEFEQEMVFIWIRSNQIRYPKLQLAYSTLNGVRLSPRLRAKMKRQGNRRGVPDIVLPVRSHDQKYSGLYLELKRCRGGSVSKEQKAYISKLQEEGYMAVVAKGHRAAIGVVKRYLKMVTEKEGSGHERRRY